MGEMVTSQAGLLQSGSCEICGNEAEFVPNRLGCTRRRCPRCGTFEYHSSSPGGWLNVKTPDHIVRLSGWVREQNDAGIEFPNITQDVSRDVARMRLPGLRERANRALIVIARTWQELEAWYDSHGFAQYLDLQGRSYSVDTAAALVLIQLLIAEGYLRNDGRAVGLSVSGLLAAESLGSAQSESAQGFVAMSFDESLRDAWTNGFDPAIRAAGFIPLRIDAKDYVGSISDEIISEIRQSSFVVADYTGQANGVYFEAGFALGMGLTVIPTCQADDVGKLHFDIKHLNTLLWKDPAELANGLSKRIIAVLGAGPLFSGER